MISRHSGGNGATVDGGRAGGGRGGGGSWECVVSMVMLGANVRSEGKKEKQKTCGKRRIKK